MQADVSKEAIDDFLGWIYRGVPFDGTNHRVVISSQKFQQNHWCMNLETAGRIAASAAEKKDDSYYRVAVCKSQAKPNMRSRGTASDAVLLTALCFDFDADESGTKNEKRVPKSLDDILKCVESLPQHLRPNKLICSGVGAHGYWRLDTPHVVDESTNDILKGFDRWLAAEFQRKFGYQFDCVNELARVLRLPGTLHCKKDPKPVYEIQTDLVRVEDYSIGEFDFAATEYQQTKKAKLSLTLDFSEVQSESKTASLLHDTAVIRMLGCKASDVARDKQEKDGSNRVVTYCRIAIGTGLAEQDAAKAVANALKILPTPQAVDITSRIASVIERGETPTGVDLAGLSVDETIRKDRVESFYREASELDTDDAAKRVFAMACVAVEFELSIHEWIAGLRKIQSQFPLYDLPLIEGTEPLNLSDAELVAILIGAVSNESVHVVDRKRIERQTTQRILDRMRFGVVERSEGQNRKYALVAAECLFLRLGMRGDGCASELLLPIVSQFCELSGVSDPKDVVREAINHGVAKQAVKKVAVKNEDRDLIFAASGICADAAIAEIEKDGGDYVPDTRVGIVQEIDGSMEDTRKRAEAAMIQKEVSANLKVVSDDTQDFASDSGNYDEVDGIIRISPREACYAVVKSVLPELHIWIPGSPTKLTSVPMRALYANSGWVAFNDAWLRLTGQFLPNRYRGKMFENFLANVVERKCAILSAREEDPVVFAHSLISQAIAWARCVAESIDDGTKRKLPNRRDIVDKHFADRGLSFNRGLRISDDEDFDRTSLDAKPRGFALERNLGLVAHSPSITSVVKANDFQISSGIRTLIINELESFGFEKSNSTSMRIWLLTFQKYRSAKVFDDQQ